MQAPDESPSQLEGWQPGALAQTAHLQAAGVGTDQGSPDDTRFLRGVAQLLRRRLAHADAPTDPQLPAVFLLSPHPPQPSTQPPMKRVPMLDNGREVVTGRLWFVSAPAVSGHYLPIDGENDDTLFALVTDRFGLGAVPAIVFDPRSDVREIRFYRRGLSNDDQYEGFGLVDQDVRLEDIYPVIERTYASSLVTPDAQLRPGRMWTNSRRHWASPVAEAIVQMNLRSALIGAFVTCIVRVEQSSPEGRDDLEIERQDPLDPSRVTRLVLIELKVLRSFGERGSSVAPADELVRVERGVEQAAAYREGKGFRESTLCCFDMQLTDGGPVCFDHVRTLARQLQVDLRRWFLYASSQDYRHALAVGRSRP